MTSLNPDQPTVPPPPKGPSLPEALIQIAGALQDNRDALERLGARLDRIESLVAGFTNDGASFGAYQVDAYTTAYLALLGPMIATRLAKELAVRPIGDLMKAAAPLTRDALEELAAYREQQLGKDILANQVPAAGDPWAEGQPVEGDWDQLS